MTTKDLQILEMTPFGPLVETTDGSLTIRHASHHQDFHSSEGAKFEAEHLYVNASGFREIQATVGHELKVLDVGLGLAYNACSTIACWLEGDGMRSLTIESLEIDRGLVEAIVGGCAPWQKGWGESWLLASQNLTQKNPDVYTCQLFHPKTDAQLTWNIRIGDGNKTIKQLLEKKFDFIWQDPFTPELNPEMWTAKWFAQVAGLSMSEAKLMTYSVARVVRDALGVAGWSVDRFRTPGRKRHWLKATLK